MAAFHGPLIKETVLAAGVPLETVDGRLHDLQFGFSLIGEIGPKFFSVSDKLPNISGDLLVKDLLEMRVQSNEMIVSLLKDDE